LAISFPLEIQYTSGTSESLIYTPILLQLAVFKTLFFLRTELYAILRVRNMRGDFELAAKALQAARKESQLPDS